MTDEELLTEPTSGEAPKGSKGTNVLLISIIVILIVLCCCCIGILVSLYLLGDWILDLIRSVFYQIGIYL